MTAIKALLLADVEQQQPRRQQEMPTKLPLSYRSRATELWRTKSTTQKSITVITVFEAIFSFTAHVRALTWMGVGPTQPGYVRSKIALLELSLFTIYYFATKALVWSYVLIIGPILTPSFVEHDGAIILIVHGVYMFATACAKWYACLYTDVPGIDYREASPSAV